MKVLIIDDEEFLVDIMDKYLRRNCLPDVSVTCTTTAEEALKEIMENDYDVVIADLKMNGYLNGELLQRINSLKPDQTFFVISAEQIPEKIKNDCNLRIEKYFEKPFDIDTIKNAIHEYKSNLNSNVG